MVEHKIILIAVFLFVITSLFLGNNLNKPFYGEHDWNGVRYGNIARNYLRYGLFETRFGQVENSGTVKSKEFEFYTHYPPLMPLLITLSYKIFGISEWSTRLVPLLATSGTISLIFLIGKSLFNFKTGALAALLVLFTPMVLYFGKNPVHEPVVLFFVLISFLGFIETYNLQKQKRKVPLKYTIMFFGGMILAELTAWAGYFLVPALTLVLLIKRDFKFVRSLIPWWILSVVIFSSHILHVYILTESPFGGSLVESLLQRTSLSEAGRLQGFNVISYLNQLRLWISALYTITLVSLSVLGMVVLGKNKTWLVLVWGIFGLIYLIVFSNSVFIHNYLIFYLLPFVALTAALGMEKLLQMEFWKRFKLVLPVLVILLIFLERREFLLALNRSDGNLLAWQVGRAINQQTRRDETALVMPKSFSYSAEKFLKFYADRKIVYSNEDSIIYDAKVLIDPRHKRFEIIKRDD